MDINLEYYKIFYYIGSCGGITAAARKLSLSQPAVSQALKQLEESAGTQLFVRNSKGVTFTREGEALYSYVSRGYELILQGEKVLEQMMDLETGEIHIGASDMTLQYYLLPHLEKFHSEFPNIKITVTNGPTPETLHYLKEGHIDFGVISTSGIQEHHFSSRKVREIEDIFVAGSKFKHLCGRKLAYEELSSLPLICLEKNTSTRTYIDGILKTYGVLCKPEFELATSDILVQFALRNMGIACVVRDFAEKYLESGELFALEFEKPIPKRHFYIVMDERNPRSSAAEKLLSVLKACPPL